jgi:hypothetical protein
MKMLKPNKMLDYMDGKESNHVLFRKKTLLPTVLKIRAMSPFRVISMPEKNGAIVHLFGK